MVIFEASREVSQLGYTLFDDGFLGIIMLV